MEVYVSLLSPLFLQVSQLYLKYVSMARRINHYFQILCGRLKARDALLTNWEVLHVVEEYLNSKRTSQHHIMKSQEKSNSDTIAYEVLMR